MTRRGRVIRDAFVGVMAVALVVSFGTWGIALCFVALVAAWVAGTLTANMVDEYWPTKRDRRIVREWSSNRRRHGPPGRW